MIIKNLSKEDFDKIVQLQSQCFPDGWSKQMLESGIASGNMQGLVAINGDILLGFITYSVNSDFAEILDILVCPAHRKTGVATTLFNKFLTLIKGVTKKVSLEVRSSNEQAKNFYNKMGFKELYVRKKYYQDGENALIMEREI